MVLPVTSCEAERPLSALYAGLRVTYLKLMKQDRLNGLALLNIHNSTGFPSAAEVRSEFLKKNCHLIELL